MSNPSRDHVKLTASLARSLNRNEIYKWLVLRGYYPESYVLPPCFQVTRFPQKIKRIYTFSRNGYPPVTEYLDVHFPKSDYTDRTFGIIDPDIHSEIAANIAWNWVTICKRLFSSDNMVYSYSFPLPVSSNNSGRLGLLRSGRMIYEFIEMAETDLSSMAYKYKFLVKTDIKNFYPSLYTHCIPWVIHSKRVSRKQSNRRNYRLFGNRLDKLFQNANDGCTNGLPIGPVVSDIVAELIASGVDREFSKGLRDSKLSNRIHVVRFKDDYRFLAKDEQAAKTAIKLLQASLKSYRLELNDDKTSIHRLPDSLFRRWVSQYHAENHRPKSYYRFKRFKEALLSVIEIDKNNPGCGVIDRFLADITTRKERLRIEVTKRTLPQIVSLLMLLADRRIKSLPKVLAILESVIRSNRWSRIEADVMKHLDGYINELAENELENRYILAWIFYFVRSNGLHSHLKQKYKFVSPIVKAVYSSKFTHFKKSRRFRIFNGVMASARTTTMLKHLDVFNPQ